MKVDFEILIFFRLRLGLRFAGKVKELINLCSFPGLRAGELLGS